jgi:methylenetetrahydrofolate--tRNA-(uracil-5-)-methyltransferase
MDKEQYLEFMQALTTAERAKLHDFENVSVFEGCMPVEIMAARGTDTLRFGPLKPVGLTDPRTGRWAYACLQLRREDVSGTMFNMVGFQTNLTFPEQKRVFSIIPALKNAEFLRYGVMHRNTFINAPKVLKNDYSLIENEKVFFAGQITGVEGYVESAASGLLAAIHLLDKLQGKTRSLNGETMSGSLERYISTPNKDFQPMNANFGIIDPMPVRIKDKKDRYTALANRALEKMQAFKAEE